MHCNTFPHTVTRHTQVRVHLVLELEGGEERRAARPQERVWARDPRGGRTRAPRRCGQGRRGGVCTEWREAEGGVEWGGEQACQEVQIKCCCLLFAICCVLSAVCCLLSVVCYLLSVVCCLLSVVCCLLSVVCCLLSAVCRAGVAPMWVVLCCCDTGVTLT